MSVNYIIFHPHNKPLNKHITIKIIKIAITEKDHIKSLGVIIDSHLNWKQHILCITKKMSRCIGISRQFVNRKIIIAYCVLIWVYAVQVRGSACATEMNIILILQNRALRIITYNDNLPLVYLCTRQLLCFTRWKFRKYMMFSSFS